MSLPGARSFIGLWLISALVGQQREPSLVSRTGAFRWPKVTESSGVAASRTHPGVLWTHNDSGDGPYLYAFDLEGTHRGTFRVNGAQAVDWEDLALGRCPEGATPCLYVADTGDNLERRDRVTIWIVPEPQTLPPPGDTSVRETQPARGVWVRYPDRAHDVEAIWVEPEGSVALVTKGLTGGIRLFRVPAPELLRDSTTAVLVQRNLIPPGRTPRWVTGAAISPDGTRVVLRTYDELHFFRRRGGRLTPDGQPCRLGNLEPQGEGVDFWDRDTLVLTSEGAGGEPGPIHLVRC